MFCASVARPITVEQTQSHAALTSTDDDFIDFALPSIKSFNTTSVLVLILNCHVTTHSFTFSYYQQDNSFSVFRLNYTNPTKRAILSSEAS
jgi:hypothetical protein